MEIALLPSSVYSDPTYHRVLSSLRTELISSGHRAGVVSYIGRTRRGNFPKKPLQQISGLPGRVSAGMVLNFHFSGWLRPWHYPVLSAAQAAGIRIVTTFQDYLHPDLPPLTAPMRKEMRDILVGAYRVTAVSQFLASMLRRDFPAVAGKLSVIPNGTFIPLTPASALAAGGITRPTSRGKYIFTVGRAAPYKGLDLLIFAFAGAVENGCDADLVVCGAGGQGPLRVLAQKLGIGNRVFFNGLAAPGKICDYMKNCLFYAAAPRWESFGMAALEAMASGKAVLTTKTGGQMEFARHGHNAFLADTSDIGQISAGILRLCGDAGLRNALGRQAFTTARGYSWGKIAEKYVRYAYR